MNDQAFLKAYNASRNGCNGFYRHWAQSLFQYSDGVKECADAGCHWLLDILATECPKVMRDERQLFCLVHVNVEGGKAVITLTHSDDVPPLWTRYVEYTDMPEGRWAFELVDEGARFALTLISEH